ncbi:uncharacterized protein LOC119102999 [Pollicipes pollicipes]|uniref:uncharacterized protein LOC119102999 n=1 Tax=Pollicipes pollicipes TaxID=41117 RepID=UPI001884B475|nr:uncharacterized protein LOC119102999 [Pollicipes pollicipes]
MKIKSEELQSFCEVTTTMHKKSKRRGKKKTVSHVSVEGVDEEGQHDQPLQEPDSKTFTPVRCETCQIQTNSASQLANHLKSKRHARRRRELRILAALAETDDAPQAMEQHEVDREALAARLARGHATMEAPPPLKECDLPGCITKSCSGKIRQKVSYSCDLCSVHLTSLAKAQEHLSSQRHSAAEQGLPPPARVDRRQARRTKTRAAASGSWFW